MTFTEIESVSNYDPPSAIPRILKE
jgi:hypothetical protein